MHCSLSYGLIVYLVQCLDHGEERVQRRDLDREDSCLGEDELRDTMSLCTILCIIQATRTATRGNKTP